MNLTYYLSVYAQNDVGYSYGNVVTFTTLTYPTISTLPTESIIIGGTTATGVGDIVDLGNDANCSKEGFVWDSSSHSPPANGTSPGSAGYASNAEFSGSFGSGDFRQAMTGLSPTTHYYVRAFAKNLVGYSFGNEVVFSTLPKPGFTAIIW